MANATTAVNAVFNSLRLRRSDVILVTNVTYSAVRSTAAHATAAVGARLLQASNGCMQCLLVYATARDLDLITAMRCIFMDSYVPVLLLLAQSSCQDR